MASLWYIQFCMVTKIHYMNPQKRKSPKFFMELTAENN